MKWRLSGLILLPLAWSVPAAGSELFGGVLVHDINSPIVAGGYEDGLDLQFGWRGDRIAALRALGAPSPHVYGSLHSGGDTHFASAGVSWRLGGRVYVRPGVGLAVHSRDDDGVRNGIRTDFGSRILFAPELGVGVQLNPRLSVEASWVHLSHAQLFSRQNPGMDSVGLRLNYKLR